MDDVEDLPYAYDKPSNQGLIRQKTEDFIVHERLGFVPEGQGEHIFLEIEKRGENTDYVAGQLARIANVKRRDIGFAGLKDRHAVTTQWFSVWLPGKHEPDWQHFETDSIKIRKIERHLRKLKRGVLTGNQFVITIREWQGDKTEIIKRLEIIKQQGVPNYFGEQRFGRSGQNVAKALQLFRGAKFKKNQRSIYLSAARSLVFNQILAHRVNSGNWNQAISGDLMMLNQSGSYFKAENLDEELRQRCVSGKIHATGALWGEGQSELCGQALAIEKAIIDRFSELVNGLEKMGLKQQRRALRVNADSLVWNFEDERTIKLKFFLPAGSYATAVLRECLNYKKG